MRWLSKKRYFAIMLIPSLFMYCIYVIIPIFISIYYSFTQYTGIGKPKWIGWANYEKLFRNSVFINSIKNSLLIFLSSVLVLIVVSFLLAVLLNTGLKGSMFSKAIIFSPAIMAPIIVGIIWVFILDPSIGYINAMLKSIGLENLQQQWIGGLQLTPFSVALVFGWQQLGFLVTIFIAGLKTIPHELYESAGIDGADGWHRMRYITVPMMRNTISVVTVLIINGTLKIFEVVLQLTNGGPNHFSETMVTYSYNATFKDGRYGYGMAMAVIVFLICFVFSVAYLGVSRNRELDKPRAVKAKA